MRSNFLRSISAAVLGLVGVFAAIAPALSAYPEKVVRIVVPFAPGGPNDIIGRLLAQELSVRWGQQVIVENRPGGGSTIGGMAVAKAPADGYTLLMASSTFAVQPSLMPNLPYNVQRDFIPVIKAVDAPIVIITRADSPIKSITDLINYAKQNPGKVTFGSAGVSSTPHLAGEYFNKFASVQMTHVPYKGDTPNVLGVVDGSVLIGFSGLAAALPHIKGGRLRAVAVTTTTKLADYPDIGTVNESGLPGFDVVGWYSLFAPTGTPAPIIKQIADAAMSILSMPEIKAKLGTMGLAVTPLGPDEFKPFLDSEIKKFGEVVKAANIKVD